MGRILVYGELPEDQRKDYIHMPAPDRGGYQPIWMSYDMWFHPIQIGADYKSSALPPSFISMIDVWRNDAAEQGKHFQATWYEKNATLKFIWFGELYQINSGAIGISPEQFSQYSTKMERELIAMGCPYTQYTGTID